MGGGVYVCHVFGDAWVQGQWGTVVLKGLPGSPLGGLRPLGSPKSSTGLCSLIDHILPLAPCPQIPEAGDHRLLDGARSLHFPRIQESDSGLYTCRAENQAGSAQRDFNLAVFSE